MADIVNKCIEIYINEFVSFFGLLSLKCNVCLTFVIKMTKLKKKIRQTTHSSHFDVICALCARGFQPIVTGIACVVIKSFHNMLLGL